MLPSILESVQDARGLRGQGLATGTVYSQFSFSIVGTNIERFVVLFFSDLISPIWTVPFFTELFTPS